MTDIIKNTRALSVSDLLFLALETQKEPMHVAGLCLFEIPKDADERFLQRLAHDMKTGQVAPTFPFNQVLHRTLFWRQTDIEVAHHFRHVALPQPAGMEELLSYVSREHGRSMHRKRPMWEIHLIEGVAPKAQGEPPRFALYVKIHHSLTDGVACMRLMQMSLSSSPNERLSLPFWALTTRHRHHLDALLPHQKSALAIIKGQVATIKPVYLQIKKRRQSRHDPDFTSTFSAPKSILNQRIGVSRRLLAKSFDKAEFAQLAKRFGVTTNDVILAICGGALRRYLISQDALPSKPLIAFVPISLRHDDSAAGNQLSFLLANLGTHQHDPRTRLATVAASVADAKAHFARMSQPEIVNYSLMIYSWAFANLMLGIAPKMQAFNLIISNIPGIKSDLYLNGARLSEVYPYSVLLDGQALNISFANYQDKIDIGITACDQALPEIDRLLVDFCDELEALKGAKNERT